MPKHFQSLSQRGLPKARSNQKPDERVRSGILYPASTNQRTQKKQRGITVIL